MDELISVCLCTYRGKFLSQAIDSILHQNLPAGVQLELIVVDNDAEASADTTVRSFASVNSVPIRYAVEQNKGLSFARNCALSLANGNWIAFIDDDELAAPDWLAGLVKTAKRYSADAVMGEVLPKFLIEPPTWVKNIGYFAKTYPISGVGLSSGRSCNALISSRFAREHGLRFDLAFNTTGGEDTDFFDRFVSAGGTIVSSKEAIVWEQIPPERVSKQYLRRRAVRSGETYARVTYSNSPVAFRLIALSRAMLNIAVASSLTFGFLPFGKSRYYVYYIALLRNIGRVRYFLKFGPVEMYR
jgi:succinoglycan biosynthesis protein ExoM